MQSAPNEQLQLLNNLSTEEDTVRNLLEKCVLYSPLILIIQHLTFVHAE